MAARPRPSPSGRRLRPDAVAVTKALATRGLDLIILSGDRPAAVAPVANALGIGDWRAGLTPAEKIAVIEAAASARPPRADGRRRIERRAGARRGACLAVADHRRRISPRRMPTRCSSANSLRPVLRAVVIARRARRLMKQNLALAVIYNALAVPIAIAGLVTPLIAALAMSGSSMLVTLNALRARLAADGGLARQQWIAFPAELERQAMSAERIAAVFPSRQPRPRRGRLSRT